MLPVDLKQVRTQKLPKTPDAKQNPHTELTRSLQSGRRGSNQPFVWYQPEVVFTLGSRRLRHGEENRPGRLRPHSVSFRLKVDTHLNPKAQIHIGDVHTDIRSLLTQVDLRSFATGQNNLPSNIFPLYHSSCHSRNSESVGHSHCVGKHARSA